MWFSSVSFDVQCGAENIVLCSIFCLSMGCDAPVSPGKLNRLLGGPATAALAVSVAVAVACWQHFGQNFAYINIYEFIKSEPHTTRPFTRSLARWGILAADWMDECISQPLTSDACKRGKHYEK